MKKRTVALLLALTLVLGVVAGGTIAWLTDKTDAVTNTFTVGDISLTLTEDTQTYQLIPGDQYTKNPTVTVTNDFDCYLFVKFEKTNDPDTYLNYTSTLTAGNGWTQGDGTSVPKNVWYRTVAANAEQKSWELILGNSVIVKENIVKNGTQAEGTIAMPTNAPTLTYQAAAVQKDNRTLAQAFDLVKADLGFTT